MDFVKKLEESQKIYASISSKEYFDDSKILDKCELFRKYYYFLPKELLDNIEKIYLEYDNLK